MIDKKFGVNIFGDGVIQTKGVRQHNVTTAEMQALEADYAQRMVGTGSVVYNTDEQKLYVFNGTVFETLAVDLPGGMRIAGIFTEDLTQITAKVGEVYYAANVIFEIPADAQINSEFGLISAEIFGRRKISGGDLLVVTAVSSLKATLSVVGTKEEIATDAKHGVVKIVTVSDELFTQAQDPNYFYPGFGLGDNDVAVSTRALSLELSAGATGRNLREAGQRIEIQLQDNTNYFTKFATLPAGETLIVHNFELPDRNAMVVRVASHGEEIAVAVKAIDGNTLKLSTLIPYDNVSVYITASVLAPFIYGVSVAGNDPAYHLNTRLVKADTFNYFQQLNAAAQEYANTFPVDQGDNPPPPPMDPPPGE